jgi:hypothetical protein
MAQNAAEILREEETRLNGLREGAEGSVRRLEESVAAAGEAARQAGELSTRLADAQRQALEEFQGRVAEFLAGQREELQRRSDSLFEDVGRRAKGVFEYSSQEAARGFEEQVRALAEPHIAGAQEAVERLAGGRTLLDAAIAQQEGKIRAVSEEAFGAAVTRFREQSAAIVQEIQDSAQSVVARDLAELEEKSGELKHATADALYKTAEWYEKKALTQLQQLTEKGVELAGQQLREQAGEVSGVFATEIDRHSRNFVEHAQHQMEETLREACERSREHFTEAAETTSAAFTDEIQRHARQELDGFGEALRQTIEETRVQAEGVRHEIGAQMTAEQEAFLRRFHSNMSSALESGISAAQQQVQGGLQQVVESWQVLTREHQEKLRQLYGHMGDDSVEQFRGRLENVSNSWMLATVTTLDRQSRNVLTNVAQVAEEKLRETCANVFANFGDTLRERLREISAGLANPNPPAPLR